MEDERDVLDAPIEEQSESTMAIMDDNTDGTASTADEPTEMSTEDIDNGNNSNDQVADNEEEVVVEGEVERPPPRLMITKMVSLIIIFVDFYMWFTYILCANGIDMWFTYIMLCDFMTLN